MSAAQAARHAGVHRSTVGRWLKKAKTDGRLNIPTDSSRPILHPVPSTDAS
ncbi:helix-turn-helix domain-containing protein [bacterium]|nr:MAG: helix-turn-helix domain-containing protein [bacterium]